jgi:AcrR family transcriptional regulator
MTRSKEQVVEQFRLETIRDAALRVIARKGITGASMQEIAEEAGIAKGTIYLYYKSQQEVLQAAVDDAIQRLHSILLAAIGSKGNFRERFETLLRAHLEFFDGHRDLFRVHVASRFPEGYDADKGRCDRAARPLYIDYLNKFSEFLAGAMKSGEIRNSDPRRLALFIEEGLFSVLVQRVEETGNVPSLDEEVTWISSLVLNGISAKRRSRS